MNTLRLLRAGGNKALDYGPIDWSELPINSVSGSMRIKKIAGPFDEVRRLLDLETDLLRGIRPRYPIDRRKQKHVTTGQESIQRKVCCIG